VASPPAPEVVVPAPAAPEAPGAPPEVPAPPPVAEIAAGPSRLAAEVALLDRARAGLGAGDYSAALAALAEYHQRFANGDLDAAAEVVMIEILIAQREIQRARTLGTEFIARFPRSPLVQRVHSLLDHLPK
jgi:TolA-binding protein